MDIKNYKILPTKHFVTGWMKKWNYDEEDLKHLLENAYKTEKVGKYKYEAYIRTKGKSRKLIFIKDDDNQEITIIIGAEGR